MFPQARLAGPVAASFQAVLDRAVQEQGALSGATASVIVGESGRGSWSGASGVDYEGSPLTTDAQLVIASVGKTVTAAQVLRLAEEGKLGLDDLISDHLPPEFASFDLNGATIRDVLGMRSGIPDPPRYEALVDSGSSVAKLLQATSEPLFPPGSEVSYQNINYILLGTVIEHVTGRPLWDVLHADVLARPDPGGLVYGTKDALAADGWQIESDTASLARWGYEVYGGFVLSDVSLGYMTDFRGDFYGLGAIDYSLGTPLEGGYGIPAVGHGGLGSGTSAALVAFPQSDVVVAVQALTGDLDQVHSIVRALKVAAEA